MRLTNTTDKAIRFYYHSCFWLHIELLDHEGNLVYWKAGVPIPESPRLKVEIPSGTTVLRSEQIQLSDYYHPLSGKYELRFRYDKRLMEDVPGFVIDAPLIPWVNESISLKLTD